MNCSLDPEVQRIPGFEVHCNDMYNTCVHQSVHYHCQEANCDNDFCLLLPLTRTLKLFISLSLYLISVFFLSPCLSFSPISTFTTILPNNCLHFLMTCKQNARQILVSAGPHSNMLRPKLAATCAAKLVK